MKKKKKKKKLLGGGELLGGASDADEGPVKSMTIGDANSAGDTYDTPGRANVGVREVPALIGAACPGSDDDDDEDDDDDVFLDDFSFCTVLATASTAR